MPPKKKPKGSSQKLTQLTSTIARKRKPRVMVRPLTPLELALAAVTTGTVARRSARAAAPAAPQYFSAPVWGVSSPAAGGSKMNVTLGPTAVHSTNYGSVPTGNTPSVMRRLLDNYAPYGWIAGHLLNDNLGGPGTAKNLTPLTTAGNKNHLNGCETLIKNTITKAYSRTLYNKTDEYWYGVEYEVVVSDEKYAADGTFPATVPTHLTVSATIVKQHKQTSAVTPMTAAEDPSNLYFAPISNLRIENTMLVVDE